MHIPEDIDQKLWFHHAGCTGRHFLLGNPHTVPGRIWAWCPVEEVSLFVSLSDIEETSPEAGYWLQGYLHGCEPGPPPEYYDDADGHLSPEYLRWKEAIAIFHQTGKWERT